MDSFLFGIEDLRGNDEFIQYDQPILSFFIDEETDDHDSSLY
jgi:hypothetical protein